MVIGGDPVHDGSRTVSENVYDNMGFRGRGESDRDRGNSNMWWQVRSIQVFRDDGGNVMFGMATLSFE